MAHRSVRGNAPALLAFVPFLACGGNLARRAAPADSVGGSAGIDAGTGGAADPTGSGASQSARPSGGTGTGGTSGAAPTTGGGAVDIPEGIWQSGQTLVPYQGDRSAVAGTLDGVAVATRTDEAMGLSYMESSVGWERMLIVGEEGQLWLWGDGPLETEVPSAATAGLLLLPSSWPRAGEYLYVANAHAVAPGNGATALSLEGISSWGSCPGEAGDGTLSWDYASYSGKLAASIGGTAYSGTAGGYRCGAARCELFGTIGIEPVTVIVHFAEGYPTNGTPFAITNAALVFRGGPGEAPSLSCLGSGSTLAVVEDELSSVGTALLLQAKGVEPPRAPGEQVLGSLGVGISRL